jgi:hypothetical protein
MCSAHAVDSSRGQRPLTSRAIAAAQRSMGKLWKTRCSVVRERERSGPVVRRHSPPAFATMQGQAHHGFVRLLPIRRPLPPMDAPLASRTQPRSLLGTPDATRSAAARRRASAQLVGAQRCPMRFDKALVAKASTETLVFVSQDETSADRLPEPA